MKKATIIFLTAIVLLFIGVQFFMSYRSLNTTETAGPTTTDAPSIEDDIDDINFDRIPENMSRERLAAEGARSDAAAALNDARIVRVQTSGSDEAPNAESASTATTEGLTAEELANILATTGADGGVPQAGEDLANLLTPEGFDVDKVIELITSSDLSEAQKTGLIAATNAVKDNPAMQATVLPRLREALGLTP